MDPRLASIALADHVDEPLAERARAGIVMKAGHAESSATMTKLAEASEGSKRRQSRPDVPAYGIRTAVLTSDPADG